VKYLLDTDTLIYWLKGNRNIEKKALQISLEHIGYSIISKAELFYGAYNSKSVQRNLDNLNKIDQVLTLVYLEETAAECFGKLKAELKQQGNIIMDADLLIASIAIANDLVLVTNNMRHFQRIASLKVENWS
jgi:tRNA(fMet)-specific endonuclease VapC